MTKKHNYIPNQDRIIDKFTLSRLMCNTCRNHMSCFMSKRGFCDSARRIADVFGERLDEIKI